MNVHKLVRQFLDFVVDYLPVKVIRDERGTPFLYRYHLFSFTKDGPGMCIHHFVKSDPDRGYHDHPWHHSISLILCGGYEERIYNKDDPAGYVTYNRKPFSINYLYGSVFHRVMIPDGGDAWTLFAFQKRGKTWGIIGLDDLYRPMSTAITDQDGGWWNYVMRGIGLHSHLKHPGNVIATVDIVIIAEGKVLLIKRGKNPFKDYWALVGGRIEQKDQTLQDAAYRELKEETNLTDVVLKYADIRGDNCRDPRGFCVSVIYLGVLPKIPQGVRAGDDAVDYQWFDLNNLPSPMAFDHVHILSSLHKITLI